MEEELQNEKSLRYRETMIEKIFTFKLHQFAVEERLGHHYGYFMLNIYFVILLISFVNPKEVLKVSTFPERFATAIVVPLFLFFLAFFGILLSAILMTNPKTNHPCAMLKVFCSVKLLTVYVVFPITNLIYIRVIADSIDNDVKNSHSDAVVAIGYMYLITFGIVAVICLAILRNNYPTRGVLNAPTPLSETLLYVLNMVVQFHQIMRDRPWLGRVSVALDVVQYVLCVGVVVMAMRYSVFWNYRLNRLYITYTCQLLVLRILLNNVVSHLDGVRLVSGLFITFPLMSMVGKLSHNLIFHLWSLRVALIHRGVDYDRYVTVFTYDLLKEQEAQGDLEPSEKVLLTMLNNSVNTKGKARQSKLGFFEQGSAKKSEPPLLYMQDMTLDKLTKIENVFTLLKLKLLFLKKSMSTLSAAVVILRKKLGKSANLSFEYFHIRALMQARMKELYSGELDPARYERTTLGEIYDIMSSGVVDQTAGSADNIDLNRVFVVKDTYEKLIDKVNRYIAVKLEMFTKLYDSQALGIRFLFNRQKVLYTLSKKIDHEFNEFSERKDTPPYILAAAMAYNLKVRFQVREAEFFFKKYRLLLSKLQVQNRLLKTIKQDNIGFDSVIFKIDISKNSLGQILDVTPGYREHLGEKGNGVLGLSINSLFPGAMSAGHAEMMANLDSLRSFNVQSETIMNGFDGFLRNVHYYVKLHGSLSGEMSSLAWVRVRESGMNSVLLVDEKLKLISADEGFWQVLSMVGYPSHIGNLYEISDSLCLNIELLKYLQAGQETGDHDNEKAYLRWKEDIKEVYKVFEKSGIIHKLKPPEATSPQEKHRITHLASTIESLEFCKKKYFKLTVTFDVSYNDKQVRNFKALLASKIANLIPRKLQDLQNTSSQGHSETNDIDSMEIATIHSNYRVDYTAEANIFEQVPFDQVLRGISKLEDIQRVLPVAVLKGFPEELAMIIDNTVKNGGELNRKYETIKNKSFNTTDEIHSYARGDTYLNPISPPNDILDSLKQLPPTAAVPPLPNITPFGDFSKSKDGSIRMMIPERRSALRQQQLKEVPPNDAQPKEAQPKEVQPTTPDLTKFFRAQTSFSPTTRRELLNTDGVNDGSTPPIVLPVKAKPLGEILIMHERDAIKKGLKKGNAQTMGILEHAKTNGKTLSPLNKTLKSTINTKNFTQAISLSNQVNTVVKKVKAQEDDVMFSFYPPNVDRLMRAIVNFSTKVTKRHADGAELGIESMASRSTMTSNSKNTTILRRVNTTISSHKKVKTVYILIFGLIFISCIYIGLFQYLNSLLLVYNESNVASMFYLTYFIGIDRALLTGILAMDGDMKFIETLGNLTDFTSAFNVITQTVNVTDPLIYLSNNIKNSAASIDFYMSEVETRLSNTSNQNSEESIVSLMSHKRNFRLLHRYATGEFTIVEMSTHSISWWKLLSTILFNLQYIVEYSSNLYNEVLANNHVLDSQDIVNRDYLQKLKVELARLVYEDNLGSMKGIMEEAMDYMITKDHAYHFRQIHGLLIGGGCMAAIMLVYLYYVVSQNSTKMFDLIDNYGLLKIWELHAMIEDLVEEQELYAKYMYHESHLIHKYVGFNQMTFALNNSRVISLQERYVRDKMRLKFRRNFWPTSIKLTVLLAILNILLFGAILLMVQIFSAKNKDRIVMENAIMTLHATLIDVECNFLNNLVYVNYGDFIKLGDYYPSNNVYESSIPNSVTLMMDMRSDIIAYFGEKEGAVLINLLFEDLCVFFEDQKGMVYTDKMNDYNFCKGLNPALTLKGLVGFLQAEKQFLDDIRMQLERDHMDIIVLSRTQLTEGVKGMYYTTLFLQYRAAHRRFIDLFYSKVIPITMAQVRVIRNDLRDITGQTIFNVVLCFYFLQAAVYALTFYCQTQDLKHFYEIYALIDPLFLVNNKYLFNKMRESYQGII